LYERKIVPFAGRTRHECVGDDGTGTSGADCERRAQTDGSVTDDGRGATNTRLAAGRLGSRRHSAESRFRNYSKIIIIIYNIPYYYPSEERMFILYYFCGRAQMHNTAVGPRRQVERGGRGEKTSMRTSLEKKVKTDTLGFTLMRARGP